jgi:hypothetical protein
MDAAARAQMVAAVASKRWRISTFWRTCSTNLTET